MPLLSAFVFRSTLFISFVTNPWCAVIFSIIVFNASVVSDISVYDRLLETRDQPKIQACRALSPD